MVFSSPVFLFLFLPITLAVHFALPWRLRNLWLLAASLVFYAWGEPKFVTIMLVSIVINFLIAIWIEQARGTTRARLPLVVAVVVNIGLLAVFKYTGFAVEGINALLSEAQIAPLMVPAIALPIGISFFTFHALSYVIDVYRAKVPAQRNPFNIGLYIALFPQLVAGPIIRYHDVAGQLIRRTITRADFAYGVERFTIGLGKKVLIANTLAVQADLIFSIPGDQLTAPVAWLGVICYTLQIYFDFSGYSDMAIGLGRMLGFRFLENFNYPYISQSLTEFWRRWHISLSNWFRDYVYIPLGGNRGSPASVYRNLFIVFFLCGLWHGASWTFVVWGLFHGCFLVLERMGMSRAIDAAPAALRHAYLVLLVMISWVLFRSDSLVGAGHFFRAMLGLSPATGDAHSLGLYVDAPTVLALVAGIVGATPLPAMFAKRMLSRGSAASTIAANAVSVTALGAILLAASMLLAAGTYNPFIYFRF